MICREGAAALLVSAAQQSGVQYQPAQIRQAMKSTTRYLSGRYQAYEQGNGLLNVNAAWDLLKTNLKTVNITSSVPVNTVLSGFLATPGRGMGIYDREYYRDDRSSFLGSLARHSRCVRSAKPTATPGSKRPCGARRRGNR